MQRLWLSGLVRARSWRLLGAIAGVALTVALIAALGAFLRASTATMTARAAASVPVDWQIQGLAGFDAASVAAGIRQSGAVTAFEPVGYADVAGFEASTPDGVQATGAGKVIGVGPDYFARFPGQARLLLGTLNGVLVAQQTAANLHVGLGDSVTIHRIGVPDTRAVVGGIVELPNADALFQAIGVAAGAAPVAPPDNVLILPMAAWKTAFDPQAVARPDTVRSQFHVGLDHDLLPADPVAASIQAADQGHHLESRLAGRALLANNLATRLDAVREDALYARILFLFLGTPGAVLAALLTFAVAGAGAETRRRDQALLRLRGASVATITGLAATEAIATGLAGSLAGIVIAEIAVRTALGQTIFSLTNLPSIGLAIAGGIALALIAILWPAWRNARGQTVAEERRSVGADRGALWSRLYLDLILIALAALSYWRSAAGGYQVVLAPEGVAATAVDYTAFLTPLLLWLGLGLLAIRVSRLVLTRGRAILATLLRPVAGRLSGVIAATFSRQSRRLTAGIAMAALAFAFAGSTAIFNATYAAQARIDAELTNGSDVTLSGTMASPASRLLPSLAGLASADAVVPMQHRYAYVGADLQDLYGIDPSTIGQATHIGDAFFANGNARATLDELARTPDGVLVAQETINDYQLARGDAINLRLQTRSDGGYHAIPFHIVGVVREFPTAPRDSFLVANAAYVADKTGFPDSETVLMHASGPVGQLARDAGVVAAGAPGVKVSTINQAVETIGSSLTAVDLSGLTKLELGFALVMVVASSGLVFALGLADRQRSFAILRALGAKPRHIGAFVWSEAGLILAGGAVFGVIGGWLVAYVLVRLLNGVFDPPPEALTIPNGYLLAVLAAATVATLAAAMWMTRRAAQLSAVELRSEP
jgi:putative ABC transport system permease protein